MVGHGFAVVGAVGVGGGAKRNAGDDFFFGVGKGAVHFCGDGDAGAVDKVVVVVGKDHRVGRLAGKRGRNADIAV